MYNEKNYGDTVAMALQHIADELAIKNMIESKRSLPCIYTNEELDLITDAIRKHNVLNAKLVLGKTSNCVQSQDNDVYELRENDLHNHRL